MDRFNNIGIIGSGAFGTALAIAIEQEDRSLQLWARRPAQAMTMKERRENTERLPGIPIPLSIDISSNLDRLANCDLVLYAGTAQSFKTALPKIEQHLDPDAPLVNCAKGIDQESGRLLSDIAEEISPNRLHAVLSGPSFAADIARGLPTALSLGCADEALGQKICNSIGGRTLRPYWTGDVIGVQVGGAMKNVIAIACGIVHGKALGESARTALMTRGLAELSRLAAALGGESSTLMGLSGIGDLALSCGSLQSRNMSFGERLGQGQSVEEILSGRSAVTEGVMTAKAVHQLAERHKLDMPISKAVYAVLHQGLPVDTAIDLLLARPLKKEI